MFYSLFVKTDVTAVRIWKDLIFASAGGFIHVYDLHSNNLILRQEIFEGQKIYGFEASADRTKFVIYGGKNIVLTSNLDECRNLEILKSEILSDWILDAKWIENDTKIVTVHMHNKVTIWTQNITSEISVKCEERCILYSAHICFEKYEDLIILSGTVFSDVLLWKPYYRNKEGLSPVLKRLKKHNGVIFSLHCDLDKGLICSTSDDRSAILWQVKNKELLQNLNSINSDQLEIISSCQVYGHLSRVFRCFILPSSFATTGEDSLVNIWSFEGKLLRKIDTHQGGPVWSIDYDLNKDIICTGGSDGGISLFRITQKVFFDTILLPDAEVPKVIALLQSGNIVCLSENATVYFYDNLNKHWQDIARYSDLKSYSLLQISPCKNLVALAGFEGQIYIYSNKNNTLKKIYTYNFKSKTRIYSLHWLTCKIFLVCQNNGHLHLCFVYKQRINIVQTFILPPSKERWSTCATLIKNHVIVGDRKGNIYNFIIGKQDPNNLLKKSHNHLGVTKLYTKYNTVISLGKDGVLKRYKLFDKCLQCLDSNKMKFSWLAALEKNYILSFSGKNFVVSDFKLQRILYETQCGGGHRSWDYLDDFQTFRFCFIKHKVLNVVQVELGDIVPKDVTTGYHVHEINCLKTIDLDDTKVLVSGGEDTLLRISTLKNSSNFEVLETLKVHLSSIRSICLYKLPGNKSKSIEYLLFTAGGRAQIICWHLLMENRLETTLISCSEKYNFYEPLCQDKVETRIMDLSACKIDGQTILFSGCSDGSVEMFSVTNEIELNYVKSIFSAFHSIIKIANVLIINKPWLLCTDTGGNVVFWDVLEIFNCDQNITPYSFKIHQSGVNSYSYKIFDNSLLFLSGGDDNSVRLTYFNFSDAEDRISISIGGYFEDKVIHCAQITGAYLGDTFFVTSSIDQRVVVWKWSYVDKIITFQFVEKYVTAIADPQGLECSFKDGALNVFVYGVGIEHLVIKEIKV